MTLTTNTTRSGARHTPGAPARIASKEAATTGKGATLAVVAATASSSTSTTLSLSESALKALAQVGEGAIEGVIAGATSVGTATKTALEGMAGDLWKGTCEAAASVEHLAGAGWRELKSGVVSIEDAGESVVDKIENALGDVASVSKAAAIAVGHYAEVTIDAATDAVSDGTLASVSLLAVL